MAAAMIIATDCAFFATGAKPPPGKSIVLPFAGISGGLSKKAEGTEREQRRHRAKYHEIGEFRKHDLAKGVEQADQQAADRHADQTAATADNDDSETEHENFRIGRGIEREKGASKKAAESR